MESGGTAASFTYDKNGGMTQRMDSPGTATSATTNYSWDGLGRLTKVQTGNTTVTFTYDGLGRRVELSANASGSVTTEYYLWAGDELVEKRVGSTGSSSLAAKYFGDGYQTVASGTVTGNYYFTHDHLGSIKEVVAGNGTVVGRYSYGPWGETMYEDLTGGNIAQPDFGYGGYFRSRYLPNLYLTEYRAYAPDLGRWLSRDPIGEAGGVNLYAYTGDDPVNGSDPLGLLFNIGVGESYDYWIDIGSNGLNQGGISGYAMAAVSTGMMISIDFFNARGIENNAARAGAAAGSGHTGQAIKYASYATGQIALAAGGQYAANTVLFPFFRFLGPASRPGFAAGTWLTRGVIGETPYGSIEAAAGKLQLPNSVDQVVNATPEVWYKPVAGPRPAAGYPKLGPGGGSEYRVGGFKDP